ncbi:MAG: L-alanine-DL-glutamate epimerase-like enolase superfamily enzyme, partial [Candidatus Latescibacterota bacterium]
MAEYPIAGCFEDPLPGEDIAGYVELRQWTKRLIVLHHFPMGATYEELQRPADMHIMSDYVIGDAVRRAGLFDAAGSPFMVQNVGGEITRAMSMHMTATFAILYGAPRSQPFVADALRCADRDGVLGRRWFGGISRCFCP